PLFHAAKPRGTSSASETSSGWRQTPPPRTFSPGPLALGRALRARISVAHPSLSGGALVARLEAEDLKGRVCAHVVAAHEQDVLQRACGDVEPAVRSEAEAVGPAQAVVLHQGLELPLRRQDEDGGVLGVGDVDVAGGV